MDGLPSIEECQNRAVPSVAAPPSRPLAHSELFNTEGKINTNILKDHFYKEGKLELEDVKYIILTATSLLRKEPNLLKLQSPMTICGDIHGQYYDLMKLLEVGGDPSQTTYLFLGDYVDRGNFSCECILLLYAYKICYPNTFFMLRGNHECRHLTEYFTFKEECRVKYCEEVYDLLCESFDCLPLAATMNDSFLCVHGGLSPQIKTLEDISMLNRFDEPPPSGAMCDLLWSDPIENFDEETEATFYFNENRGCSFSYGYKAVTDFLTKNKLFCLLRAHEAQDNGFKMYRQNPANKFPTVITLFSAPNYLDAYGNKGAVMVYDKTVMNIRQFQHSEHPYWLPNFMDVITWSIPFVSEKVSDILLAILKLCDDEDEAELERQKAIKKEALRKKILLVGKLSRMYGTIRTERETEVKLKGLSGAPGTTLPLTDTSTVHFGDFVNVKRADKRNEMRPSFFHPRVRPNSPPGNNNNNNNNSNVENK